MRRGTTRRTGGAALPVLLALLGAASPAGGQERLREDAFLDATALALHGAARGAWERMEEDVTSYTAVVKKRFAVDLRLPLKDRTLYRQENASRVFWNRDGGAVIQVLGAREWHPGWDEEDEDPPWRGGSMDAVFDPAGDRLFFGLGDDDEDVWFEHPLGRDATEHYRFRGGDTITLALPDGRRVQAIELQVLPREADVHRISGSLWIEPESGSLVRAVYRLSETIDMGVRRSGDNLNMEPEDGEVRESDEDWEKWVPGVFRPITFDLSLIAVDYGLWDFRVWLPRSMRVEGTAGAGVLKVPAAMEISYRVEAVGTEADVAEREEATGSGAVEERHFRTKSEALAYLAELAAEEGVAFRPDETTSRRNGRPVRYLLPTDTSYIGRSPHIPPPIWEEAAGFATEEELKELVGGLADLPAPPSTGSAWAFNWAHQRPDLLRYNRVEGLSVGARLQGRVASSVGPLSVELVPFLGTADWEPKARLGVTHESLRRKVSLGAYRELEAVGRGERHLGLGNSATALLFGRDDGEYFLATGAEVRLGPPSARRASWELRLYAERQEAVETATDFNLAHVFADDWDFRPNVEAVEHDEVGAALLLSPWWGTDPLAPQAGVELHAQGATGELDYARTSVVLRGVVPLFGGAARAGVEVGGGESWGDVPLQRNWFLGSTGSLRGYEASTLVGPSFLRARAEVARVFPVTSVSLFGDWAWAGNGLDAFDGDEALFSVGIGASLLDGVIRLDVARGLRDPKQTRWYLYLDGIL